MSKQWIEVAAAAFVLGAASIPGVAMAQSLAEQYKGAKSSGLVGEQIDGYIAPVSTPSASIEALVSAINIKRKEVYFKVAGETQSRPDQAAAIAACTNIKNTKPGEYYQAPDRSWKQRTDEAPLLSSNCPQ